MLNTAANKLHARSVGIVQSLQTDMRKIMLYWTIAASLACGVRIAATAPGHSLVDKFGAMLPYALVVAAPIMSLMLALHWFRDGTSLPQPRTRLARFGRWRTVGHGEAAKLPLYGVTGLMTSLLLGILLNVPVRSLEFLTAIPAITSRPTWLGPLSTLMLADVVLLSSLYCIAFVAALRAVPMFPRLLAAVWVIDISMQHLIAQVMANAEGLPPAVGDALQSLLEGNVKKVLISFALWTPYLLLSKRVNLTFRHRVPA